MESGFATGPDDASSIKDTLPKRDTLPILVVAPTQRRANSPDPCGPKSKVKLEILKIHAMALQSSFLLKPRYTVFTPMRVLRSHNIPISYRLAGPTLVCQ